ncbi:hypothetical protein [Legionella sp.]|uniref:hypothetical protein n=1 Tax=Legionella sp. TaxID=459 RepID=UPI00321F7010
MTTSSETAPEDAKSLILQYINSRLEEWADWARLGANLGIGYPRCAIEYRMMTEGHVMRRYSGLTPMPTHPSAEEVEQLVREMAALNRKMSEVITHYYLHPGGIREQARKLGMSHALFEMHLNTARWWFAGRLSSKSQVKELTRYFKQLQL